VEEFRTEKRWWMKGLKKETIGEDSEWICYRDDYVQEI
jgi:hypothetical protein